MPIRDTAIEKAIWWAQPDPYVATADDLRTIFEGAGCEQVPSQHDLDRTLGTNGGTRLDTGCYVGGARKHWCGIFAAFILRSSGARVQWSLMKGSMVGPDISGTRPKTFSIDGVQAGDVCFIEAGWHHFLVTDVSGGELATVEGNTGQQRIMTRHRTKIAGHYNLLI